jgi:hypothetical protein
VVVCPSSLVFNWQAEIKRWLGDQRLQCLAAPKTLPLWMIPNPNKALSLPLRGSLSGFRITGKF